MTVWRVEPVTAPAVTVHKARRKALLSVPLSDGSVAVKELADGDAERLARALDDAAAYLRQCATEGGPRR